MQWYHHKIKTDWVISTLFFNWLIKNYWIFPQRRLGYISACTHLQDKQEDWKRISVHYDMSRAAYSFLSYCSCSTWRMCEVDCNGPYNGDQISLPVYLLGYTICNTRAAHHRNYHSSSILIMSPMYPSYYSLWIFDNANAFKHTSWKMAKFHLVTLYCYSQLSYSKVNLHGRHHVWGTTHI